MFFFFLSPHGDSPMTKVRIARQSRDKRLKRSSCARYTLWNLISVWSIGARCARSLALRSERSLSHLNSIFLARNSHARFSNRRWLFTEEYFRKKKDKKQKQLKEHLVSRAMIIRSNFGGRVRGRSLLLGTSRNCVVAFVLQIVVSREETTRTLPDNDEPSDFSYLSVASVKRKFAGVLFAR